MLPPNSECSESREAPEMSWGEAQWKGGERCGQVGVMEKGKMIDLVNSDRGNCPAFSRIFLVGRFRAGCHHTLPDGGNTLSGSRCHGQVYSTACLSIPASDWKQAIVLSE